MTRAVLSVVLICGLAAAVPHLGAQTQSPPGYPAIGQPSIITVLSTGAAPRRLLRYKVATGHQDHMNMDMLMELSMNMGGMEIPSPQMPTMRMGADLAATIVAANGDASYTMKFTEMTFVPAPGTDPALMSMLQGVGGDYKSIQGSAVVSNRGVSRDMHFDFSKLNNPQLSQMMGSFSQSMENLSTPLPEPEVGIGARWEVRQAVDASGMKTFQKYEFELVSADEQGCTLKTKVEQTAPSQPVNNPAMPPGTQASIEKLAGAGTGTITMRWDSLVPTSDVTMKTDMIMNVTVGGASQQMAMGTTMKIAISRVK